MYRFISDQDIATRGIRRSSRQRLLGHLLVTTICAALTCGAWSTAQSDDQHKALPSFSAVTGAVLQGFEKQQTEKPEEIISCGQVEPIFARLKRLGWEVSEKEEILAAVPAENDFIVRQLRTTTGRKFMRQIARYPNAYDRLDHLSRLPHGKQTVRDLIRGPDGYKMIEYMTTASGGIELGKMLSKDPHGAGFNKPTGRIYTVSMLLARLKEAYATASGENKTKSTDRWQRGS